jgi:hypothetical protein
MKTYYLDDQYRLHLSPADGLTQWEDVEGDFDGKSPEYIEGFRVVPEGETWVREDGAEFSGLMIAAAVPFEELDAAQREYERAEMADMKAALALVGVTDG